MRYGLTRRGSDLYNNGTTDKGMGVFQRYQVGGGDMEVFHLNHEQPHPIYHHSTWCPTWVHTGAGYRDSHPGGKYGAVACSYVSKSPISCVHMSA